MPEYSKTHSHGKSIGGMETSHIVPYYNLMFDIGGPGHEWSIPNVFITHTHMDHVGGLVAHCATRNLKGAPPADYYVPAEKYDAIQEMFDVWKKVDGSRMKRNVIAVKPGGTFPLNRVTYVKAFRSVHTLPCVGYAICERKSRLREDLRGKSGQDIATLVRSGVDVNEYYEEVLVAFCGDTTIDVLDREPWLYDAKHLILECTFIDDQVVPYDARRHGHVHLDEVLERAELFKYDLTLTHFSSRYKDDYVEKVLCERWPHDKSRAKVTALIGSNRTGIGPATRQMDSIFDLI